MFTTVQQALKDIQLNNNNNNNNDNIIFIQVKLVQQGRHNNAVDSKNRSNQS